MATDSRAALDIRELSVEAPAGDQRAIGANELETRAQANRKVEGSPEFRRKFADTDEEIPKNGPYLNTM